MGFIATAFAAGTAAKGSGGLISLLPMIVIFVAIFYFLIWRPQSKRNKAQKTLLSSMKRGDEVLTSGGLVGTITKISDSNDYVSIALNENNEITLKKSFIVSILPKNTTETAGSDVKVANDTSSKK